MIRFLNPKLYYFLIKAIFNEGINLMTLLNFASNFYKTNASIIFQGKSISYRNLYFDSKALSAYLSIKYGIKESSKVAIISRNNIEAVKYIFAFSRLGAKLYILNPDLSAEQLDKQILQLNIDLLVFENELNLTSSVAKLNLNDKIENVVYHTIKPVFLSKIILLTGGTSGKFKTAERTTAVFQFVFPFYYLLSKLKLANYNSVFVATPIYHGFGFATLLMSIFLGSKIYLQTKFDANEASKLIKNEQIEVIALVPTMLRKLLETLHSLTSLKCIISGGAKLDEDIVTLTIVKLGNILYNLYGTSEAGFCIIADSQMLTLHSNCIGKPITGVKAKIENVENGIGELYIKSAWTMSNKSSDWVKTGDLATVNQNGIYFLKGRTDEMIVSGGENVYFSDLEIVLKQNESIEEVAVVSVDDTVFGKRLKAFVTMKPNIHFDKFQIMNWLKPKVARFQMPVDIVCLDEFKYTSVGKIDKKHLA